MSRPILTHDEPLSRLRKLLIEAACPICGNRQPIVDADGKRIRGYSRRCARCGKADVSMGMSAQISVASGLVIPGVTPETPHR